MHISAAAPFELGARHESAGAGGPIAILRWTEPLPFIHVTSYISSNPAETQGWRYIPYYLARPARPSVCRGETSVGPARSGLRRATFGDCRYDASPRNDRTAMRGEPYDLYRTDRRTNPLDADAGCTNLIGGVGPTFRRLACRTCQRSRYHRRSDRRRSDSPLGHTFLYLHGKFLAAP